MYYMLKLGLDLTLRLKALAMESKGPDLVQDRLFCVALVFLFFILLMPVDTCGLASQQTFGKLNFQYLKIWAHYHLPFSLRFSIFELKILKLRTKGN